MVSHLFFLALSPLLLVGSVSSLQQPPEPATDVRVTVRQEGTPQRPLEGAKVTLSYFPTVVQEQSTDAQGVARFIIPVDASLTVLSVSYPGFREVEMPYVNWQRNGRRAETVVAIRDRPPFPTTIRVASCEGIIRMDCSDAEGTLFLYRKGFPGLLTSEPLRGGPVNLALPFPPDDLEVVVSTPDGKAHFFSNSGVQHLSGQVAIDLIIRGGRQ